MNVPPFIQAPVNRWQKSTSYFPYIMYNTKKIRIYRDVQYGKNTASGCTIWKNNVRSRLKWVFLIGLKLYLYNKTSYWSSSSVVIVLLHTALFYSNFEVLWKLWNFWKFYHFEFFWNSIKFLKVLKFYENFEFKKKMKFSNFKKKIQISKKNWTLNFSLF